MRLRTVFLYKEKKKERRKETPLGEGRSVLEQTNKQNQQKDRGRMGVVVGGGGVEEETIREKQKE